jgi:integrase
MPVRSQLRLTKKRVDAMQPGELLWDADVKGFGVRDQGGRKAYVLKARINGRQRWLTIGSHGAPWTVETARQEAQRLWGDIRRGLDLAALRADRNDQPTVADLAERYLSHYAAGRKKPSSIYDDRRNLRNHILPLLGQEKVSAVARERIEEVKRAIADGATSRPANKTIKHCSAVVRGGPIAANRCLALLSKLFNLAESWQLRPRGSNPVTDIARYPERRRQRFLSRAELARVFAVLDRHAVEGLTDLFALAAIRLYLFTGARLSEILTLRWANVDLERRVVLLDDSKTGAKPIFLSNAAVDTLASLPRVNGNEYVIVGAKDGRHLVNIQKPWRRIRKEAAIDGTRIHDLRHTFASYAGAQGASLLMIGQLLGHTRSETTKRYAHLVAEPLQNVVDKVGTHFIGGPPAVR